MIQKDDQNQIQEMINQELKKVQTLIRYIRDECNSKHSNKQAIKNESTKALHHLKKIEENVFDLKKIINLKSSLLKEIQKLGKIGCWEWDINADEITWSDELFRIFGVQKGTKVNYKSYLNFLHPEDRKRADNMIKNAVETGKPYSFYHRIVRKIGVVRILLGKGSVLKDEKGNPVKVYGTAQDLTEKVRYEIAVKESEKKYRLMVETMGDGLAEISDDGVIRFVNNCFIKMTAFHKNELIGTKLVNLLPNKSQIARVNSAMKACNNGKVSGYELQLNKKNGERLWVNVIAAPCFDEYGNITGSVRVYRNITKTKQDYKLFKFAVEASNTGMMLLNHEGVVILCNSAALKLFGYKRQELLKKHVEILIPYRFRVKHADHWGVYFARLQSKIKMAGSKIFAVHKDGYEIPVEVELTPFKSDEETYFLTSVTDVSEKRKYEQELISLARFPEENPHPVIRYHIKKKKLLYANKAAKAFPGFFHNKNVKEELQMIFRLAFKQQQKISKEITFRERTFTCTIVPFPEQEYVNFYATDITYKKQAEDQILNAKRLAEDSSKAKEIFLANMSHEIRTPMNAIIGIIQLLEETRLSGQQRDYLRYMKFAGDNLLRIINDVLDLSRIESGKLKIEQELFNLNYIIKDIENSAGVLIKEKDVDFILKQEENIPNWLIGDPVRLNQILLNLIGNSVKFTDRGYIKLSIKKNSQSKNDVRLVFEIEDTGVGIPEEKQKQIFLAFEQAHTEITKKYEGAGLGLSIVKKLLELQNGNIYFESEEGKGSLFNVEIPYKIGSPPEGKRLALDKHILADLKDKKVLIVEDNNLNQMVARKMLLKFGLNVDVAGNGKIAVNKIKENNYDAILMDLHMPEMDGYSATRYIREELKLNKEKLPVIAMTARVLQGEKERCVDVGMNDYLSKPIKQQELKEKLMKNIRKQMQKNNV